MIVSPRDNKPPSTCHRVQAAARASASDRICVISNKTNQSESTQEGERPAGYMRSHHTVPGSVLVVRREGLKCPVHF